MKADPKIIETKRLMLKPLKLADAPFILQLLNTPSWLEYIGDRKVRSLKDAERYLQEGSLRSLEQDGYGYYLLTDKILAEPIGVAGLGKRADLEAADIGFALLPEQEGKGYAQESCQALIEAAKTDFQLASLLAITTIENRSCINLLGKLNFKFKRKAKLREDETVYLHYELLF